MFPGLISINYGAGRGSGNNSQPIDWAKERDEVIANMKRQYAILKNMTHEYQQEFLNDTKPIQDMYKEVSEKISWYFREPTDNETMNLDKILERYIPFGAEESDYMDTNEKMEEFCR